MRVKLQHHKWQNSSLEREFLRVPQGCKHSPGQERRMNDNFSASPQVLKITEVTFPHGGDSFLSAFLPKHLLLQARRGPVTVAVIHS